MPARSYHTAGDPSIAAATDAATHQRTTASAGTPAAARNAKPTAAIATSSGPRTALTQMGSYNAAASRPTTAALTPAIARAALGRATTARQRGRMPATTSSPGR